MVESHTMFMREKRYNNSGHVIVGSVLICSDDIPRPEGASAVSCRPRGCVVQELLTPLGRHAEGLCLEGSAAIASGGVCTASAPERERDTRRL